MRKLFISVLGTGLYDKTKYTDSTEKVRFIQLSTLEVIDAKNWTATDKALFLLTEEARTINWNKTIKQRNKFNQENEFIEYVGLEQELLNRKYPCQIDTLAIPKGDNETDINQIFTLLFEQIEEDDELYFDLTHGFRYLPMLVLVLGNYTRFLKDTKIKHISYGNYDHSTKRGAIIDLLPLTNIQEWTNASNLLIEAGDPKKMVKLAKDAAKPLNMKSKGKDVYAQSLRNFAVSIEDAISERAICRGIQILEGKSLSKAIKNLTDFKLSHQNNKSISSMTPLLPIVEKIEKSSLFDSVDTPSGLNLIYASKWCYEHNQYQQAYTLLQEGIITLFCEYLNIDNISTETRDSISSFLQHYDKETEWKGSPRKIELMKKAQLFLPIDEEFCKAFIDLSNKRNDLNHAGIRQNSLKPIKITSLFKEEYDYFIEALQKLELTDTKFLKESSHTILLNVSNHPSSKWESKQIEASKEYGSHIIDIPFPQLKKDSNREKCCSELVESILNYVKESKKVVTVHIMGEMALTFHVVNQLQSMGIPCVSSFSERVSIEKGLNTKESSFNFEYFTSF